ncbi:MAG: histidine phosphatase family protein [Planctomycetaceae bacterium]|nr:histidine phosphatase family protein [Planctomycetaceae bacterium]
MKTLLLMRHAKSSWDNPGQPDHDRVLNARGLRDAPRMAEWVQEQGRIPDSITCSTAARAFQTALLIARTIGHDSPLRATAALYHADLANWLAVIRDLPESSQVALCVGHNPGVEGLVSCLSGVRQHMSTAAVAVFDLPISDWRQFDASNPLTAWTLWRPKDLPGGEGEDD